MIRIIGALFIVTILNIIAISTTFGTADAYDNSYKSRTVILLSERILSLLKDVELGQRGFSLTKNTEFLEPYYSGRLEVKTQFNRLKNFTKDIEESKINNIATSIDKMLALVERAVEDSKGTQYNYDGILLHTRESKKIMDKLRIEFDTIQTEQDTEFKVEVQKLREGFTWNKIVLALNTAAAVILVLLGLYQFNKT
jgi:CHASE3 domain sensor protein